MGRRLFINTGLSVLAAICAVSAAIAQEVHYAPEERLDAIDAALIATARHSIDLASYALTDPIVLDALNQAEHRGVMIRILLDPRERHDFVKLGDLSDNVRIKRGGPFMHLKAYEIDGTLLRTGSANFSTSGENAQDNDLIVIRDAGATAKFEAHFERMWGAAQPMIEFEPAIKALDGFVTFADFTCQPSCALEDRTKENQSFGALVVGAKSTKNGLFLASVTMPSWLLRLISAFLPR